MYASDYGFATTPDYWITNLYDYNAAAKNTNWLCLVGYWEWLLSPQGNSGYAWIVGGDGNVYGGIVKNTNAVRPSFYLSSSVQYDSGSGTMSDPIRLKI